MGLIIDNIKNRLADKKVVVKPNGDGFLLTSKRYCPLTGAELEDEYETLTVAVVEQQRTQHAASIANLRQQKDQLLLQVAQIDENILKAEAVLPEFDYLLEHLKSCSSVRAKEKK